MERTIDLVGLRFDDEAGSRAGNALQTEALSSSGCLGPQGPSRGGGGAHFIQEVDGQGRLAVSLTLFPGGPDGPGSPVGPGDPWCQRENRAFRNQGQLS